MVPEKKTQIFKFSSILYGVFGSVTRIKKANKKTANDLNHRRKKKNKNPVFEFSVFQNLKNGVVQLFNPHSGAFVHQNCNKRGVPSCSKQTISNFFESKVKPDLKFAFLFEY